jgi:hypothetical protein
MKALPAFPGGRAAFAPSIARILRNAGLGPDFCPEFVDPMCGGLSVAYYAALLGYTVTASDILPQRRAVARLFLQSGHTHLDRRSMVGDDHPAIGIQRIRTKYSGCLPEVHERRLARLTASAAVIQPKDQAQADHLITLAHHTLLSLLPTGTFSTTARAFASRVDNGQFDQIPRTQEATMKRALQAPGSLLKALEAQILDGMTATPHRHDVPDIGEAVMTVEHVKNQSRALLFLDPPQPYGKDIRTLNAAFAAILTGDAGSIEATPAGKPEDVYPFWNALIQASPRYRAVMVVLDSANGRNSPTAVREMLEAHRPGAKTTVEVIGRQDSEDEPVTDTTSILLNVYPEGTVF